MCHLSELLNCLDYLKHDKGIKWGNILRKSEWCIEPLGWRENSWWCLSEMLNAYQPLLHHNEPSVCWRCETVGCLVFIDVVSHIHLDSQIYLNYWILADGRPESFFQSTVKIHITQFAYDKREPLSLMSFCVFQFACDIVQLVLKAGVCVYIQ